MSATKGLARIGVGIAAAGVGAALGLAAERFTAGRALAEEQGGGAVLTPYGALRGRPRTVLAEDGTKLHVEIDALPESATAATGSGESARPPGVAGSATEAERPTIVFTHGFALNLD